MDKENQETVLSFEIVKEGFCEAVKGYDFIKSAYLFGSYARNEATKNSDIDIFVELNGTVGWKLYGLAADLEKTFQRKVDLLTSNEVDLYLTRARKDAKKIYG